MIWKHLGHDIQVHLEPNPAYIAANKCHPKDDFKLWSLIVSKYSGGGAEGLPTTSQEKERVQQSFDTLTMGSLPIDDFYKLFVRYCERRVAVGFPAYTDCEMGSKFLSKLDPAAYGEMNRDLENRERMAIQRNEQPHPYTLAGALEHARGYIPFMPVTKPTGKSTNSVLMTNSTSHTYSAHELLPGGRIARLVAEQAALHPKPPPAARYPKDAGGGGGKQVAFAEPYMMHGRPFRGTCSNTIKGVVCGGSHPFHACTEITGAKLDSASQDKQNAYLRKRHAKHKHC